MKNSLIGSFIVIFLLSCIDRVDLEKLSEDSEILVVEGEITNQPGPYEVSLFFNSNNFSTESQFSRPIPVTNALVRIEQLSNGSVLSLPEVQDEPGIYRSNPLSPFVGEVGESYRLLILHNGIEYESEPEEILEPVRLDDIKFDFNGESEKLEFRIDFTDPQERDQYYQWTYDGYREVRTVLPPIEGSPGAPGNPDTVECCAQCYTFFEGKGINILEDQLSNGSVISNILVAAIDIPKPVQYLVNIQQKRISESQYSFLRQLRTQEESKGGLFDPPPFKVRGNLRSVNSSNDILGFFGASGVFEDYVQFNGVLYADDFDPFEGIENDCRFVPRSDTITPPNWVR